MDGERLGAAGGATVPCSHEEEAAAVRERWVGFRVPAPKRSWAIVMTYCLIPKGSLTTVYIILAANKNKISWAKPLTRRAHWAFSGYK